MELVILSVMAALGLYLEEKYRVILFHSSKERYLVTTVVFGTLIAWELLNRHVYQAWVYPGHGLVGWFLFGLPLELYLFCLIIPHFSFIVYELVHSKFDRR